MHPRPAGNAGLLGKFGPLIGAVAKSVRRNLRPVPSHRLPSEAAPDQWNEAARVRVSSDEVRRYLEITDGIDLVGSPRGLLPPLFFTTWFLRPYLEVLGSDLLSLNLLGIVHLENELIVRRPLRLTDDISVRAGLEHLDRNERRVLVTVRCENQVDGETASISRSLILARLARSSGSSKARREEEAAPPVSWEKLRTLRFPADLGRRYGLLTGDVNPIHLHSLTSQLFGFKKPIAHGFCQKAMVAHALVRSLGGGDIARLQRLNMRFRSAVWLPSQADLEVHDDTFRIVAPDGERIHAEGEFTLRD